MSAEKLRAALEAAAKSLEAISTQAGKDELLREWPDVRAYAANRAKVAREALAAEANTNKEPLQMTDALRDFIEGMSVSVDVSTGDHDAGHRYFGTVSEVMDDPFDRHGVTLLVQDAQPNFTKNTDPRRAIVPDGSQTVKMDPTQVLERSMAIAVVCGDAAKLFRRYEEVQKAKGPGHEGKVERNATMARHLEVALAAAPPDDLHLADLALEAAKLLRLYEESHKAKGPGHEAKVKRNADMAGRLEAALSTFEAQP